MFESAWFDQILAITSIYKIKPETSKGFRLIMKLITVY